MWHVFAQILQISQLVCVFLYHNYFFSVPRSCTSRTYTQGQGSSFLRYIYYIHVPYSHLIYIKYLNNVKEKVISTWNDSETFDSDLNPGVTLWRGNDFVLQIKQNETWIVETFFYYFWKDIHNVLLMSCLQDISVKAQKCILENFLK